MQLVIAEAIRWPTVRKELNCRFICTQSTNEDDAYLFIC